MMTVVVHMGLCAGVPLIKHFLDHYYRLGADRFLVILHAEAVQGGIREEAIRLLRKYDVFPAMEVSDYTYELRRTRINQVLDRHVTDDEWVQHADLDEFHCYPATLKTFLAMCDAKGYTFVQGRWVDRIAEDGRPKPITLSPSLWAQFPLRAEISALGGGWTTKVCAARGFHRSGDGGTHSIDFGMTPTQNYELSSVHRGRYPLCLAIDHFKWDATVMTRLEARRLSYQSRGLSVHKEAERILAHFGPAGVLALPAVPAEPRQFHYTRPSRFPADSEGMTHVP